MIILRDSNEDQKSSQSLLEVKINKEKSIEQEISSPTGQYLQMTETSFQIGGMVINRKQLTGKINAKVDKIDQFGQIKIRFDQKMIVPKDLHPIVETNAIKLYLNKYDGEVQYLNKKEEYSLTPKNRYLEIIQVTSDKNWNITDFVSNSLTIQINFEKPLDISSQRVSQLFQVFQGYDNLDVKFSERYFFVSQDKKKTVSENYEISREIPPQLPNDGNLNLLIIQAATKALVALASTASSAVTGAITSNIFLSLVMGLSLKKLWMLIQTLQIIVHLPLLSITLPANAALCFKSIVDISNMNIIPKEYIQAVLSTASEQNSNNLGMLFFILVFSVILGLVTILIRLLSRKYQIRRLVFAFSIVYFGDQPLLQAILQIICSLALIVYLIHCKPYKSKIDFTFEIYNEATLLSMSYFLIVYIDIVNDIKLRYDIGWYMIILHQSFFFLRKQKMPMYNV
ncbi:UNKNOWN [Stylonychia lemnae]|uniref:Transmembrane protein n=1 Tax=Stylonychia lemnae TaxID=5949 RepID=A0A078A2C1_STYLE|nr:UNKNOWN [Stylonychia lemnae]|eukprot:CDW74924.1 UNKNOWN [Stylonychia lemnae]